MSSQPPQKPEGHDCPHVYEGYAIVNPRALGVCLKTTVSCQGPRRVKRYLVVLRRGAIIHQRELTSTRLDHVRSMTSLVLLETCRHASSTVFLSMINNVLRMVDRSVIDSSISLPYILQTSTIFGGISCKLKPTPTVLDHANNDDRKFLYRLIMACVVKMFKSQSSSARANIITVKKFLYYASHRQFLEHILKPAGFVLSPDTNRTNILRGGEAFRIFIGDNDIYNVTYWFVSNAGFWGSSDTLDDLVRKIYIES